MPAHQRVRTWIARNYKKPAIDQEWLADCSDWVASEFSLDPDRNFDQFIQHVEAQLLQSNLADSTVPGSGIDPLLVASGPDPPHRPRPSNVRRPSCQAQREKKTTGTTPLLVEIKSITEIAHSAFSLLNTHQTRLDRADLGLAREVNAEQNRDEDEGPVPRFPRGMLKFELSDGLTTFRAIEFRSLPELDLGETPLGYKMFLKSTPIRNGIAFLEPANVDLKGYKTEDHDVNREHVFLSSLRKRLGRPDPPPEEPVAAQLPAHPPPQAVPAQPAHQCQPPPGPPPPDDFDDMYVDDDIDPDVLREMAIQMDSTIDMQENQRIRSGALQPANSHSTSKNKDTANSISKPVLHLNTTNTLFALKAPSTALPTAGTSPYFSAQSSTSNQIPDIGLSPRSGQSSSRELNLDKPSGVGDQEASKIPSKKLGSTSTKSPSSVAAKHGMSLKRRSSSPDSFDDLSFDMDVDDSFLEQVGMIEEGALGTSAGDKGKGKAKDIGMESTATYGHPNITAGKKAPSGSASGMAHLAPFPVSFSSAEPSTRVQSNKKRATSASSLSGSTESFLPRSTQSSDRRLPRDPSLIIISSSEDDAQQGHSRARPLDNARGRVNKGRKMDQDDLGDPDVIDISD